MSDWGARLVRLAQGALPSEKGVTPVMRRNGHSRYVSEVPVVTPVTPVTPSRGSFPKETKKGGVTDGVTLPDEVAERAALIEYGVGVPREWAEGFARLDLGNPPAGFNDARWRLLLDDGGRFLDGWAGEAARLGWQTTDVFGIHPLAPSARFDAMGLVPVINGGEVVAITERSATIQSPGGSKLVYMRRPSSAGVCLWELAS
jgi:hypothetical protein